MTRTAPLTLTLLAVLSPPALAQSALPAVDDVAWKPFRAHCLDLLKALDALKAPLPADTVKALRKLLDRDPRNAEAAVTAVRKLLDAHCLIGVSINAESRVKAQRGPTAVRLVRGKPTVVLVRIHNEAGVTHALGVDGPQLVRPGKKDPDRWLEAAVLTPAPLRARLSGRRLEYRVLRLTPKQAGKREATLRFDVGQGTQDLGFRAEVPILFTVRTR
jgi:hypothetical protein